MHREQGACAAVHEARLRIGVRTRLDGVRDTFTHHFKDEVAMTEAEDRKAG